MRVYRSFRLPRGYKSRLVKALNTYTQRQHGVTWRQVDAYWRQSLLSELVTPDEHREMSEALIQRLATACGTPFRADEFSIVLHWGCGEVPSHSDGMAKTCFLVPLVTRPTLTFFVEYDKEIPLGTMPAVRFNDHDRHGLNNPFAGHYLLMSLTRDRL